MPLPPLVRHFLKFNAVGAVGLVVQAVVLALLLRFAGLHYLPATLLAVEAAVLHNFLWHKKWTWADRPGVSQAGAWAMLLRFHLTTGVFSVSGNLVLMLVLVGGVGIDPFAANLLTIAACWLINFLLSDRLVFVGVAGPNH